MSAFAQFVGQPYGRGDFGCFLLAARVYRQLFGICLPAHTDVAGTYDMCTRLMTQVNNPTPGDLVLLRTCPWHVGVVTTPGNMLHVEQQGGTAIIERYDSLKWAARVQAFYRWSHGTI